MRDNSVRVLFSQGERDEDLRELKRQVEGNGNVGKTGKIRRLRGTLVAFTITVLSWPVVATATSGQNQSIQKFLQNIIQTLQSIGNLLGVLMIVALGIQLIISDSPNTRQVIKDRISIVILSLLLINLAQVIVDTILAGV